MLAQAITQATLTQRDKDNINAASLAQLRLLNQIMNQLTDPDNQARDINFIISKSSQPGPEQIFYNDLVTIEDDINPNHNSADSTDDVTVEKYLNDLTLFYTKPEEPNTIVFSKQRFLEVQQQGELLYVKGFFTSTFKSKHTTIKKPYLPTNRVVELRAEKVNNKWQVRIIRLGFFRPGEAMQHITQTKPSAPGATPTKDGGRPTIPDNLSINSAEVPFRQSESGAAVSIKFNREWLQVVQSGAVDLPVGFYERRGKLYAYDDLNTVEFQNNNTRFVFHKGLEYTGFDRVMPERVVSAPIKTDSMAKPLATAPPVKPAAAPTPKPPVVSDTTRRIATVRPPDYEVKKPVEKKKERPIVAKADPPKSVTTLTQSLSADAKRQKARYRTLGLLQIVGGVAGLAGSYLAYSTITKDYSTYKAQVDKLNAEYNAWRDVARNPSGSTLAPMSMSGYGKPGTYGAYAGGGISLGLIVNGIRSLGKAGRVKSK